MSTSETSTAPRINLPLWRLYLARFGFAIVWAALVFATASTLRPVTVVLLVLYPLVDLAAAIVDIRSNRSSGSVVPLYLNVLLSLLAAIGIAVAASSGVAAVLQVWGAWAITAGVVQLIVALGRRKLRGQWILVISGGLSVLVGAAFIAMASGESASLATLGGYATAGGIFFLVSALRLRSAATASNAPLGRVEPV